MKPSPRLQLGVALLIALESAPRVAAFSASRLNLGSAHSCSWGGASAAVYCWGDGSYGQLGNRSKPTPYGFSWAYPAAVARLPGPPADVAAGSRHTCAVLAQPAGKAYCWGSNDFGQLGNGNKDEVDGPVEVVGLPGPVRDITVGSSSTCAVLSGDGSIYCWGANAWGQLGTGDYQDSVAPVRVQGLPGQATNVATKDIHVCALLADGSVYCWGSNLFGGLGNGTNPIESMDNSTIPLAVAQLPGPAKAIDAGLAVTCALLGDAAGSIYCWGDNSRGELGTGTLSAPSSTPVAVANLPGPAVAMAVGNQHACALVQAGGTRQALCWGSNERGQVGPSAGDHSPSASPVGGLDGLGEPTVLDCGGLHTCAVLGAPPGQVVCWGSDDSGQLGDGTTGGVKGPTPVAEERDQPEPTTSTVAPTTTSSTSAGFLASRVGLGAEHTCAWGARPGSVAYCWGNGTFGQLGNQSAKVGDASSWPFPAAVSRLPGPPAEVVAGEQHTCTLLTDPAGKLLCWGLNSYGQLGNGGQEQPAGPVEVVGLPGNARAISVGKYFTCAVLASQDGSVYCWGYNGLGQLGTGSFKDSTIPVKVQGLPGPATAVTGRWSHACALLADGSVYCWGENTHGCLGNGTSDAGGVQSVPTPVQVAQLPGPASAIDAGKHVTCAVLVEPAGSVYCWGNNENGALGTGSQSSESPTPVAVVGLPGPVVALSVGEAHACVLAEASNVRQLFCWGDNHRGQLGPTGGELSRVPIQVGGLEGMSAPSALDCGGSHTCIVLGNPVGRVVCWGLDDAGQLGDGDVGSPTPKGPTLVVEDRDPGGVTTSGTATTTTPTASSTATTSTAPGPGPAGFVARRVVLGAEHTCGWGASATSPGYCWGDGTYGQLGNRTRPLDLFSWPFPAAVSRLPGPPAEMVSGSRHTCAILTSPAGKVYCWGANDWGQLGIGNLNETAGPVEVLGLPGPVRAISAGLSSTCAVLATEDGSIYCWGANTLGQLGTGNFTSSAVPVKVIGLPGPALAVTNKALHACALLTDGRVYCWGSNLWGGLGNGTSYDEDVGNSTTPVAVALLPGPAKMVHAGFSVTCALLAVPAGSVYCWGDNSRGQLGTGRLSPPSSVPVAVEGLPGPAVDLSVGESHACVLADTSDLRQVLCWGSNDRGQLGPMVSELSRTPTQVSGLEGMGNPSALGCGGGHTCVVLGNLVGQVACWGTDDSGQLGDGVVGGVKGPTLVLQERDQPSASTTVRPTVTTTTTKGGGKNGIRFNVLGVVSGLFCAFAVFGIGVGFYVRRRRPRVQNLGAELLRRSRV